MFEMLVQPNYRCIIALLYYYARYGVEFSILRQGWTNRKDPESLGSLLFYRYGLQSNEPSFEIRVGFTLH